MGVILNEKGEVIRSFTGKNGNSTDDRWIFQAQLSEAKNSQTVERHQHAGFASRAPEGSKLIITKINGSYLVSVAEYDKILNSDLAEGETRIYASDGSQIVCEIYFKTDGSIDIEAPTNINITAPIVNVTGDVIADSGATQISLLNHFHLGNLGYNTGTPEPGVGIPKPGNAPTYDDGDQTIDFETVGAKNVGTMSQNVENHTHTQPNDGGGDAESPTNAPA